MIFLTRSTRAQRGVTLVEGLMGLGLSLMVITMVVFLMRSVSRAGQKSGLRDDRSELVLRLGTMLRADALVARSAVVSEGGRVMTLQGRPESHRYEILGGVLKRDGRQINTSSARDLVFKHATGGVPTLEGMLGDGRAMKLTLPLLTDPTPPGTRWVRPAP